MKTQENTPSDATGTKHTKYRYYCHGYENCNSQHCDTRPHTIQCSYCIDKEKNYVHAPSRF